jgi:hypothetical protein
MAAAKLLRTLPQKQFKRNNILIITLKRVAKAAFFYKTVQVNPIKNRMPWFGAYT